MAVNPVEPKYFALALGKDEVRVYDTRMLNTSKDAQNGCLFSRYFFKIC